MTIKQRVKDCIKNGDTGLAISTMLDFVKGNPEFSKIERDFMLLSSQLQQYEKKSILGLAVEKTERNRIDMAILSFLNDFQEGDIKIEAADKQPKNSSSPTSKNIKIKANNAFVADESIQIGIRQNVEFDIETKETTIFKDKSQSK